MGNVKISLRDPGTEIRVGDRILQGREALVVEDSAGIRQLKKSGLISIEDMPEATKPEEQQVEEPKVEAPKEQPAEPVKTEPQKQEPKQRQTQTSPRPGKNFRR